MLGHWHEATLDDLRFEVLPRVRAEIKDVGGVIEQPLFTFLCGVPQRSYRPDMAFHSDSIRDSVNRRAVVLVEVGWMRPANKWPPCWTVLRVTLDGGVYLLGERHPLAEVVERVAREFFSKRDNCPHCGGTGRMRKP